MIGMGTSIVTILNAGSKMLAIAYLATVLVFTPSVDQQVTRNADQIERLNQDVKELRNAHLDVEIAKLQQTVDDDHELLKGIGLAVLLMGLESIGRIVRSFLPKPATPEEKPRARAAAAAGG